MRLISAWSPREGHFTAPIVSMTTMRVYRTHRICRRKSRHTCIYAVTSLELWRALCPLRNEMCFNPRLYRLDRRPDLVVEGCVGNVHVWGAKMLGNRPMQLYSLMVQDALYAQIVWRIDISMPVTDVVM